MKRILLFSVCFVLVSLIKVSAQTPVDSFVKQVAPTDTELGNFPYLNLPNGYQLLNKSARQIPSDYLFFPFKAQEFTLLEGSVWMAYITLDKDKINEWSLIDFYSKMEQQILGLGGKKIFDGKVTTESLNNIKDEASYFGEEGSIDYWNNKVKTYIIRPSAAPPIFIQISGYSAGGAIQILQLKS